MLVSLVSSQISFKLFFFLIYISLCCSDCVISIIVSFKSLLHFSVSLNLMFIIYYVSFFKLKSLNYSFLIGVCLYFLVPY